MWAIMIVQNGKWHTHSQESHIRTAKEVAAKLGAAIVPWESRLYLLDNGMLEREIEFPGVQ